VIVFLPADGVRACKLATRYVPEGARAEHHWRFNLTPSSFVDVLMQDGTSPTPGFDTSTSMKVIKREMRKVHALHEAIMPKSIVPGASTRQRSPSRRSEEDIDPAEQMRARRKRGGVFFECD
jgi:hypothetical protein